MSLVFIPELEPGCNSWIVSNITGEVIGEYTDIRIVGSFRKDECIVETANQFLKKVDERIVDRKQQIKELEAIKAKLLLNSDLKSKYENFVNNATFWYGNKNYE